MKDQSSSAISPTEGKAPRPPNKRMSISLSGDVIALLEFLAETQGITQNEALRKAIATEAYFLQERNQGSTVLLQKSDKEIREVVFR
jgi:hypothetical protein